MYFIDLMTENNLSDKWFVVVNIYGTITISAVSYEMFARIDISDTGAGISESEQSKIFTRFYRSKNVREQEGVGIGLYLARQIISGEGGYIKVASAPGKGSTFSIFLPK